MYQSSAVRSIRTSGSVTCAEANSCQAVHSDKSTSRRRSYKRLIEKVELRKDVLISQGDQAEVAGGLRLSEGCFVAHYTGRLSSDTFRRASTKVRSKFKR